MALGCVVLCWDNYVIERWHTYILIVTKTLEGITIIHNLDVNGTMHESSIGGLPEEGTSTAAKFNKRE
jgi:hypothetical protein